MAINDVKVKIDLVKPVTSTGFGVPLILADGIGDGATETPYTECASFAEVNTLWGSASDANIKAGLKAAELLFMQDNAPAKIAICATKETAAEWVADVDNQSKNWRQLIATGTKASGVSALSTAIEATDDKIYFAGLAVDDSTKVENADRTYPFYVTDENYANPEAALVGATAGLEAGSFTYKNIILKGIKPQSLKSTEVDAIHAKNGNTFVTKAGDNVTSEGKVASGEYLDIIDSQDFVIQQITYRVQKLLNTVKKLPYDNKGIAQLENVVQSVLLECANMGIIAYDDEAGNYLYSTNFALRDDCTDVDRASRKYIGGSFTFQLAGAIHNVEVTGEIEI